MFNRRTLIPMLVLVMLGLLPAFASAQSGSVTIKLNPQNNSGESGTATLTAKGEQTEVVLNITGQPNNPQPVHIHQGTCANLNPTPAFPLTVLNNGSSTTTVPIALKNLLASAYAINGHKSPQDIPTYVFCGDIKAATSTLPQTGGAFDNTTGLLLALLGGGVLLGAAWILQHRRASHT